MRQSYRGVRLTITPPSLLDDTYHNVSTLYNEFVPRIKPPGRVYIYQLGKFPHVSSRGYRYIMVLHIYDFNTILSIPLRSKSDSDQLAGIKSLYDHLKSKDQMTNIPFMDNEAPWYVTKYLNANDTPHQLVSPNGHRHNAADRAIGT